MYSEPNLQAMSFIRAIQAIAVIITGWSLSKPWGQELAAGKGPPSQWERHVVGATLLLAIAALAMMLTARGKGSGAVAKPSFAALGIAALCGLGALGVTLTVRSAALSRGLDHALLGGGWTWMLSGTAIALGATSSAALLRVPIKSTPATTSTGKSTKHKSHK